MKRPVWFKDNTQTHTHFHFCKHCLYMCMWEMTLTPMTHRCKTYKLHTRVYTHKHTQTNTHTHTHTSVANGHLPPRRLLSSQDPPPRQHLVITWWRTREQQQKTLQPQKTPCSTLTEYRQARLSPPLTIPPFTPPDHPI